MRNPEVSSVRHLTPTSVIIVVVLLLVAVIGGSSPAPHPSESPQFQAEQTVAQPVMEEEEEEDYEIWNPTPYFGGGHGAPIPHVKAACCPHLPCCSHFHLPFPHST